MPFVFATPYISNSRPYKSGNEKKPYEEPKANQEKGMKEYDDYIKELYRVINKDMPPEKKP